MQACFLAGLMFIQDMSKESLAYAEWPWELSTIMRD